MVHDGRIIAELFKEELKLKALHEFEKEIKEFGIELQVFDQAGKVVVQSDGWDKSGVVIDNKILNSVREGSLFKEMKINKKRMALFSRPVRIPSSGPYSLHIVRSQEQLEDIADKILGLMLIIIPIMLILSAIAGTLFSTRTLAAEQRAFDRLKHFTADAAHELRIPLTSLRGNLEVALRKDRPVNEYKETIQGALEEAEHLSLLTQDLLLLAQTDAERLKLNIHDVELKGFLEDVFSQVESLPDNKKIKKVLRPVPQGTVQFDPDRIKQLLLNLVDNAIKYGIPNGEMNLGAELTGGELKLIVRDNGIGIPKEEQGKIFDRFYRVDKSRSRQQGGSGLGLSIVQWIVNAHGGRIQVESQKGEGTTFTVTLPV